MSARVTRRLWVVAGLNQERGSVVKFGPTSEQRELLEGWELYGSGIDVVAVLPVMEGALLRVRERDVREALADAVRG